MVFNIIYLSQIWFCFWDIWVQFILVLYLNKKVIILCFHSFNKNGQKKRKLFPFSYFVCFVSAIPYTQVLLNVVNFPVSDTLSVQFTKFNPLSFHLHVPFQNNRHRKKKIQNRKPIFCLQKLKRTLLFYQHLLQSNPFCNYQIFPKKCIFV